MLVEKKISVAQDTEAGKEFFTKFDFGVMVKVTRKLLHDICVR